MGPGERVVSWTASIRAVSSKIRVTQLTCEKTNARNEHLQFGCLLQTLAGSSDLTQEQNEAINDLAD